MDQNNCMIQLSFFFVRKVNIKGHGHFIFLQKTKHFLSLSEHHYPRIPKMTLFLS